MRGRRPLVPRSGPVVLYRPVVSAKPRPPSSWSAPRVQPNHATAADNAFQRDLPAGQSDEGYALRALAEMDAVAEALRAAGVRVHVFEGRRPHAARQRLPNNWLSTHAGGYVAVYPMYASNRRHERRADVLEMLKSDYRCQTIVDYSGLEPDGIFLGAPARWSSTTSRGSPTYMVVSHRADTHVLERFCSDFNYEPMAFEAVDADGVPVYHTNVMGCVGTDVAMFALDMIPDKQRREQVREAVLGQRAHGAAPDRGAGAEFAGNAVELCGRTPEGRRAT